MASWQENIHFFSKQLLPWLLGLGLYGIILRDSTSYKNQAINAVKFYYERVLGGQRKVYLVDRPREEKTLPVVLSEKEVGDLLKATENLKHKAILMLAYSAGLRLSELINVKIADIDSGRWQIRVEPAYIPCDIRLPLTFLKMVLICATFKAYWGTQAAKRQRFTRI